MICIKINEVFINMHTIAEKLFHNKVYPWEVIPKIEDYILNIGPNLPKKEFDNPNEGIWIAKNAYIGEGVKILGPCIIDHSAQIRHCAFIRGNAIVGKNAVIGNSTELKNSIIFDQVQAPHYNYIGDSILGYASHMGAGSIMSNVKADKKQIKIKTDREEIETGLKKLGGIIGDFVEVGCSSVINPGTIIGPKTNIYPLCSVRGVIPSDSIYKKEGTIIEKGNKN